MWSGSWITRFLPRNSKQSGYSSPLKGTKPGVEAVTVLKIYRLPKWDMGVPNTPTYTPPQGSELIVVRFKRTALANGQELALNQVALFEEDGQAIEDAPRDIWAVSTGQAPILVYGAGLGYALRPVTFTD